MYSLCVKLRLLILNTWETKSKWVANHDRNEVIKRLKQILWGLKISFLTKNFSRFLK